jgi:hypothetical protein
MGRQVNFYFSDSDQAELTRRLDSLGDVMAILPPLSKPMIENQSVSHFTRWKPGEHDPMLYRSSDTEKIVFRRSNPATGYFIDIDRSPVVEFSRCATTNDTIRRGRLYYVAGFLEKNLSKYTKPSEFVDWADKLFKLAKKLGVEIRNGDYIGREALEMEKLGYRFLAQ